MKGGGGAPRLWGGGRVLPRGAGGTPSPLDGYMAESRMFFHPEIIKLNILVSVSDPLHFDPILIRNPESRIEKKISFFSFLIILVDFYASLSRFYCNPYPFSRFLKWIRIRPIKVDPDPNTDFGDKNIDN